MTTARNKRAKIAAYNRIKNTPPKETNSIYESITGKTNPEWADRTYNPQTYQQRKTTGAYPKRAPFKVRRRSK